MKKRTNAFSHTERTGMESVSLSKALIKGRMLPRHVHLQVRAS